MKLLIATGNPSKLEMFKYLLKDCENLELLSLGDFPQIEEPEEDGKTPAENALIKAKYYSEKYNIPALADDAGFELEDLGGVPGVKARRWGGELSGSVSDEDFLEFFLQKIEHVDKELLKANYPYSRCLYLPNGEYFFQPGKKEFFVSKKPRRPYKKGRPLSSVTVLLDGRHFLDVSEDDPILLERHSREGLFELIGNLK